MTRLCTVFSSVSVSLEGLDRKSAVHQKTGKRFINQALYIKSLNYSISTCMKKTIATYKAYLKALHTHVKASILQLTIVSQ